MSDEIASRESREVIGNLVLFFPLGAFLPFVSSRFTTWWRPALIAFFFSFALEFAQYLLNLGRLADIDDAILNSTGAVLGSVSWRGLATFRAQA